MYTCTHTHTDTRTPAERAELDDEHDSLQMRSCFHHDVPKADAQGVAWFLARLQLCLKPSWRPYRKDASAISIVV